MKITLTKEESLNYFYNALCNGLGYVGAYGIQIDWDEIEYQEAKAKLKSPCFEDILIQILKDGGTLDFSDKQLSFHEVNITLKMVEERVSKTPFKHLLDMVNGNDDAVTADVIIQTVLFEDVVFG